MPLAPTPIRSRVASPRLLLGAGINLMGVALLTMACLSHLQGAPSHGTMPAGADPSSSQP